MPLTTNQSTNQLTNQPTTLVPLLSRSTIEGLASAISKDLRPTTLAEALDLGDEEGACVGVASACLNVLVLGLNTQLDAPLQVGLDWVSGLGWMDGGASSV